MITLLGVLVVAMFSNENAKFIETVNEKVHKKVCPSKPIQPYLKMFDNAQELGLQNAITIIIGLGETIDDFPKLKSLIEKHNISKIHFYCLNPQKGTVFNEDDWNRLLDFYYKARGYDLSSGLQTNQCLTELEMPFVIDRLESKGFLR